MAGWGREHRAMNEVTGIPRAEKTTAAGAQPAVAGGRLLRSDFQPAPWLRNRHLQTIYPSLPIPGIPKPRLVRETLELPDGDVTVVDWLSAVPDTADSSPLLVILHGLESSARSTYARQLLHAAARRGWRAAVLHFRDCGDYCNRLPRRYHAGETGDIRYFLGKLRSAGHRAPLFAAGFSLGGNVLLKYLGESGQDTPLSAAVAVSVPLNLHTAATALSRGFSRVYQRYLLTRMKRSIRRKFDPFTAAFDWNRAMRARTFAEFDDAVTAPLHGFADKDDYYDRCSAVRYLGGIARPSLVINALDDPFMTPEVIPEAAAMSEFVAVEVSERGGHVGFIYGGTPWRPCYYVPRRIIEFLDGHLGDTGSSSTLAGT